MAYAQPTSLTLFNRYREFMNVDTLVADQVLIEAAAYTDACWVDADRLPAVLALAAHMLVMEGEPDRSRSLSVGGQPDVDRTVLSQAAGGSKLEFAPIDPDGNDLQQTVYGRRFLNYLKRNVSSVMVTGGCAAAGPWVGPLGGPRGQFSPEAMDGPYPYGILGGYGYGL